jgi:hypothetical protein
LISTPEAMSAARPRSKIDAAVLVGALAVVTPRLARADALRLRGDALVETKSPVGLVVLRGEDKATPWLDAETVTWMGAAGGTESFAVKGDVLTLSVRARDVASGSEMRAGRMVVAMGALRPVQLDGARLLGRTFGGTSFEAFGGIPVLRLDQGALSSSRRVDWTTGGRLAQTADVLTVGAAYGVRRLGDATESEEAGADFALTPAPWFTAAGRAALDLVSRGPSEALASVSTQKREWRAELFTTHRAAGRLLPSTSLFSVLGDVPATNSGGTVRWRAFPRLELLATGSVEVQGSDVGGQGLGRSTLALDDAWDGSLGLEIRHVDFGGARWTGARTVLTLPLGYAFRAGAEVELVRSQVTRNGSNVWPWALGSFSWRARNGVDVAVGVEGSSGPSYRDELHALARLSYALGVP